MADGPNFHHRRSIRLRGYDYTQAGGYFVTICTRGKECTLGEVTEGRVRLTRLGEIVRDTWFQSAKIRKGIRLFEDEFVVMPNHVHGIVWIVEEDGRGACHAPLQAHPQDAVAHRAEDAVAHRAPLRRMGQSLGSMVAGFKASVTSQAKRNLGLSYIWQRNYYEHIIRDEVEWGKFRDYIEMNPQQWAEDELFSI
jgi:putative transposase